MSNNKKSSIFEFDANLVLVFMYGVSLILYLIHGCCYFVWVIPMLVYIFETKNIFVRKQASQAIILFLIGSIFSVIMYLVQLALVPVTYVQYVDVTLSGFRLFLTSLCSSIYIMGNVIIFILSLIAIIRVYNYNDYTMPIIGDYIGRFRGVLDKIVGTGDVEDIVNESSNSCNISVGELVVNKKYKNESNKKVVKKDGK